MTSASLLTLGCSKFLNPYLVHSNCRKCRKNSYREKKSQREITLDPVLHCTEELKLCAVGMHSCAELVASLTGSGLHLAGLLRSFECNLHVLPVALQIS